MMGRLIEISPVSDESEAVGHHDLAMPDPVYESDPAAEPDTSFVAGELSLAAAGNRGLRPTTCAGRG